MFRLVRSLQLSSKLASGRLLSQSKGFLLVASNELKERTCGALNNVNREARFLSFGPTQPVKLPEELNKFIRDITKDPFQGQRSSSQQEEKGSTVIISEGITRALERAFNAGKPLTSEDRWILASWLMLGTTFWVIVGSTSLLCFLLWMIQPLFIQESIATAVGNYVSTASGLSISFQSAIVPNWKKQRIRIKKVKVVRDVLTSIDQNGSEFNLDIDRIDVKISLLQLLTGRGLLQEIKVDGVKGYINQKTVWDFSQSTVKTKPVWGEFDLSKLVIQNLHIIINDYYNKSRELSIFHMKSSRLRQHWFLFDLMASDFIHGSYDNRLFSVQTALSDSPGYPKHFEHSFNKEHKTKINHLHIHGIDVELLTQNCTSGPLSWINKGFIDIDAYYRIPLNFDPDEYLSVVPRPSSSSSSSSSVREQRAKWDINNTIPLHVNMDLRNLNASVPIRDPSVSYLNNALIRPIVAYMNTNYVSIPLNFDTVLYMSEMESSWYPADAKVYDALSESVYYTFVNSVMDQKTLSNITKMAALGIHGIWRGCKHLTNVTIDWASN